MSVWPLKRVISILTSYPNWRRDLILGFYIENGPWCALWWYLLFSILEHPHNPKKMIFWSLSSSSWGLSHEQSYCPNEFAPPVSVLCFLRGTNHRFHPHSYAVWSPGRRSSLPLLAGALPKRMYFSRLPSSLLMIWPKYPRLYLSHWTQPDWLIQFIDDGYIRSFCSTCRVSSSILRQTHILKASILPLSSASSSMPLPYISTQRSQVIVLASSLSLWRCSYCMWHSVVSVFIFFPKPKSHKIGQSAKFSGKLDIYEWGWLWVKIQLCSNLGKQVLWSQKCQNCSFSNQSIENPKLHNISENQSFKSIKKGNMKGFPLFNLEKWLILSYFPSKLG